MREITDPGELAAPRMWFALVFPDGTERRTNAEAWARAELGTAPAGTILRRSDGTVIASRRPREDDHAPLPLPLPLRRRHRARSRPLVRPRWQGAVIDPVPLLPTEVAAAEELRIAFPPARPRTRGECGSEPRPCRWVGCRHNLFLDVRPDCSLLLNYLGREPEDVPPERSCALDVADRGGQTLEEVGDCLGVTRERIRQIEARLLWRLRRRLRLLAFYL